MSSTIFLNDSLIINQIEELFSQLKQQFHESDNEIIIDGSAIDTIDTSGLQSLLILIQHALQNGKTVQWSSVSETLTIAAAKLGLTEALVLNA